MSEAERIAREAVALCADLLRRYHRELPGVPMVRPEAITEDRHAELGQRVLAWQDQLDQAPSPVPRVWKEEDPEPGFDPPLRVRDCQGDVWRRSGELGEDGRYLWVSRGTARFGWDHIAKKWGPLTEVVQAGSNPDGGADD